jgi:hypothetical protein
MFWLISTTREDMEERVRELALTDPSPEVRQQALLTIWDEDILKQVAQDTNEKWDIRIIAIDRIHDEDFLEKIIKDYADNPDSLSSWEIPLHALSNIEDFKILKRIYDTTSSQFVKDITRSKLKETYYNYVTPSDVPQEFRGPNATTPSHAC